MVTTRDWDIKVKQRLEIFQYLANIIKTLLIISNQGTKTQVVEETSNS